MKARRTDRRMAIPLEEIEASTRYSRKDTFISEQEASARAALGMMIMGAISLIFICFALWVTFYAIGKAEAHSGHIYAKSEITKAEIKQLNIMPAKESVMHDKNKAIEAKLNRIMIAGSIANAIENLQDI